MGDDWEARLLKDNLSLFSALSWAVGALEATGHDAGYARQEIERFLKDAAPTGSTSGVAMEFERLMNARPS